MKPRTIAAAIILLLLFILVPPVSATVTFVTSWHDTITKGDTVTLTGTGFSNGTVSIWVIGRNYLDTRTAIPDRRGNFSFVFKPEDTRKFSSGQYAILVQDPGQNAAVEIEPFVWDEGIKIAYRGKIVTDIGKKENLGAFVREEVDQILQTTNRSDVDDIITPYYYYIEEPVVHFDAVTGSGTESRLPGLTTGDKVVVSGTTNVGVENQLRVEIRNQTSRALIIAGSVPVVSGSIKNRWSYELDEPGLQEGEYFITAGWLKGSTGGTGSALLTVAQEPPPPMDGPAAAHGLDSEFDIFLPVLISAVALAIIGIIILASVRR